MTDDNINKAIVKLVRIVQDTVASCTRELGVLEATRLMGELQKVLELIAQRRGGESD
jgi:hypothetical protein